MDRLVRHLLDPAADRLSHPDDLGLLPHPERFPGAADARQLYRLADRSQSRYTKYRLALEDYFRGHLMDIRRARGAQSTADHSPGRTIKEGSVITTIHAPFGENNEKPNCSQLACSHHRGPGAVCSRHRVVLSQ